MEAQLVVVVAWHFSRHTLAARPFVNLGEKLSSRAVSRSYITLPFFVQPTIDTWSCTNNFDARSINNCFFNSIVRDSFTS